MYLEVSPYQENLANVEAALASNDGIITLTGAHGTGKTALGYQLSGRLQQQGRQVVFFLHAPRNPAELQAGILRQLHLREKGDFTQRLTDYLLGLKAENRQVYVLIDNAQGMDQSTCHAVRVLRDIQHEAHLLVRLVLLGSPELDDMLAEAHMSWFAQHVSHSFQLPCMRAEQVSNFCRAYWRHRKQERAVTDESWSAELLKVSGGLPGAVLAELGDEEHRDEINISARIAQVVAAEHQQPLSAGISPSPANTFAATLRVILVVLLAGALLVGYRFLGQPATPVAGTASVTSPANAAASVPAPSPAAPHVTAAAVAAVSATAAPALSPAVEAGIIAEAEVVRLLNGWVQNWQVQNLPGYFASYGADFMPESRVARVEWEAERRRVISAARGMNIGWRELQIRSLDPQSVVAELWLDYASSTYADRTLKELTLGFENGRAVILRERNLTVQP